MDLTCHRNGRLPRREKEVSEWIGKSEDEMCVHGGMHLGRIKGVKKDNEEVRKQDGKAIYLWLVEIEQGHV
ncbi:hypothetical protein CEXT_457471 [Caerostris extrusa]|uniref:Uncharacterized protein n=1 Tax=Caerostris extrusa TaxID=172846 RepID=A0AAV4VJL6_CAEEX|nr:hypothetical protein CEXT_457471 [Caerostris extrusa]